MARKIIFLIITTILIFMLVFFPASIVKAEQELVIGIDRVSISSTSSYTYDSLTVYNNLLEARNNSSGYVFVAMDDPEASYDNFILLKGIRFTGSANYSYTRLYVNYKPVNKNPDEINYIEFNFSYLANTDVIYPSLVLYKSESNTLIPETDYSIAYSLSSDVTPAPPNTVPATLEYRVVECKILFNSNIDLSEGLRVGVNQYVYNYYGQESSQIYGFTNLKVGYISNSEYLGNIVTALDDVKKEVVLLTDVANQNNELLSDILDSVNTPLTPEQQRKLFEQDSLLVDIRTEEALTEEKILELKKYYLEDYSYDYFGNDFNQQIDDYVEPLFENDGFTSFWFGLWSHRYIVSMFIIVVSFCWMGFIFYGTR